MVNSLQSSAFVDLQKNELYEQVRQAVVCYSFTWSPAEQ